MSFRPTFDRVVIERDADASVSPGGIALPKTLRNLTEKAAYGTIVAVGPGRWNKPRFVENAEPERFPMSVKVGDRVMFSTYDVTEFETRDNPPKTMVVTSESAILGVID